jgi:DnaJ-class molecular chaperone
MKYHPDHQLGSDLDAAACSERTRQIIAAYGVLRDKNKRRQYDASYRRR